LGLVRLTDKDLIRKVIQGEDEAFNQLVARWEKKLFNYAYRLTSNREDALDICQESLARAYEQLPQLKDTSRFSFWLFKIARNCSISRFRQDKHRPQTLVPGDEDGELDLDNLLEGPSEVRLDGGQGFQPSELRLIVERALDQLPFEQRETIVLKIYEGLKFSEIAEISECPISTVKSRLYLGLTQMRKILSRK
jgi:RNA polymerase sigma-70 factor (ECF subfamily)